MSTLYSALGVDSQADAPTIRHAYRALARRYHPDSGGDVHQMMQINEAWHVLSDPERRAEYDKKQERPVPRRRPRDGHSVMDFGRYEGWSLGDIVPVDDDYLEWLSRTPMGRPLRAEITQLLADRIAAIEALRPAPVGPTRRLGRH